MDPSVDRLAIVSKIMLDTRLCALRSENNQLRLALFWKDHSCAALNRAILYKNDYSFPIKLPLDDQALRGLPMHWIDENVHAKSRRRLLILTSARENIHPMDEPAFLRSGLTCHKLKRDPIELRIEDHFYDLDCHIVFNVRTGHCIGFGSRLYKRPSPDDVELQKLASYMRVLLNN